MHVVCGVCILVWCGSHCYSSSQPSHSSPSRALASNELCEYCSYLLSVLHLPLHVHTHTCTCPHTTHSLIHQYTCSQKFTGSVQEVVLGSIRRSLAFPLFRHWQLSLATLEDTRALFRLGRQRLLQCLLEVHQLLASSDPFYVFNDLYITDYCVWLQGAR